ncbi:ATP-dependent DNA helicase pif3 [Ancistrocladus abbreviatus]
MVSHAPQITPTARGVSERMTSKPAEGPISADQFEAVQHESTAESDKFPNQPHGGTVAKAMKDCEKAAESVHVASSVCSGSSMQRASNDPTHYLKKKCSDTRDSEGPSEEV